MLNNLKIKNYRLFKDFEIPALANVNLIVGENNSGKSSLLEAIHLLTSDDVRSSLFHLLKERGEYISSVSNSRFEENKISAYQIAHIFYNHLLKIRQTIKIFDNDNKHLNLQIALFNAGDAQQLENAQEVSIPRYEIDDGDKGIWFKHSQLDVSEAMYLNTDDLVPAHNIRTSRMFPSKTTLSKFISTNYLGYDELSVLWDHITLTPKEDKIIEALQILEPSVNRISFTSSQTSNSGILLRLDNQEKPIPLGSMGDGMRRILTIAASLVNVSGGTLLIDEIDTGLYYVTLVDMWKLILKTAQKEKVQVFATTHSNDCIKAFTQALNEFEKPEFGKLIRLDKKDEGITATSYMADELHIAVEQDIEVR